MRTVLITGGARGIGLEVARVLARQAGAPWNVLLAVRDLARGQAMAAELGRQVCAVSLDVARPDSIAALAASPLPVIDVLVNNAALYEGPVGGLWATNVRGPIVLTRALAAAGRLALDATIVNVTSGLGALSSQPLALRRRLADPALTIDDLLALPPAGYGQSKAVLNAYSRLLAREWPERVVNAVSPGWCRTDMGGRGAPRSVEQGAASLLHAIRLRPGDPTGRVFEDGREIGE